MEGDPIKGDVVEALNKLQEIEESSKKQETPEAAAPVNCPICGYKPSDKGVIPSRDKEEFHRSILGNRLFSKVYRGFSDKLSVQLQAMRSRDSDSFNTILLSQDFVNEAQLIELGVRLKFLYMIKSITLGADVKAFTLPEIPQGEERLSVPIEFNVRFGDYSDAVIHVVTRMVLSFDSMYKKLVMESLDHDFYEGAGPF